MAKKRSEISERAVNSINDLNVVRVREQMEVNQGNVNPLLHHRPITDQSLNMDSTLSSSPPSSYNIGAGTPSPSNYISDCSNVQSFFENQQNCINLNQHQNNGNIRYLGMTSDLPKEEISYNFTTVMQSNNNETNLQGPGYYVNATIANGPTYSSVNGNGHLPSINDSLTSFISYPNLNSNTYNSSFRFNQNQANGGQNSFLTSQTGEQDNISVKCYNSQKVVSLHRSEHNNYSNNVITTMPNNELIAKSSTNVSTMNSKTITSNNTNDNQSCSNHSKINLSALPSTSKDFPIYNNTFANKVTSNLSIRPNNYSTNQYPEVTSFTDFKSVNEIGTNFLPIAQNTMFSNENVPINTTKPHHSSMYDNYQGYTISHQHSDEPVDKPNSSYLDSLLKLAPFDSHISKNHSDSSIVSI